MEGPSKRRALRGGSIYRAFKANPAVREALRQGKAAGYARRAPVSRRSLARLASRDVGYVDLAFATYAIDTTGTITLVATIAQGASVNQRIGKKAILKSVQIRGSVYNGSAASINDCTILLVYDRQPAGALPAITDILVSANSRSFNNDVNSDRFKIVRRWDFELLGPSGTPVTGEEGKSCDFFVPLNLPIQFKAAGDGAIADISNGALYLVTVGNSAAGTGAATAGLGFRTRFIDA